MINGKILVIDDDDGFRNGLQFILEKQEYSVITARNGTIGLKLLEENIDIKVVIVDLAMLDISGVDVLESIENHQYPIRRIVLTAHDEELTFKKAEKLKVFAYHNKPVAKHALIYTIRSAFNDLYREELERELEIAKKWQKLGQNAKDYVHIVGEKAASIPDSLALIQKEIGEISASMKSEFSHIKGIANQLIDLNKETIDKSCISDRTCVFIGSSKESIKIAKALEYHLAEEFEISRWDQSFQFSTAVIESLYRALKENDFAIFVMNADDLTTSREVTQKSPRDNVIFEIGLFMGYLGRSNVFIVCDESDSDMKIPSDLAGVLVAPFKRKNRKAPSLIKDVSQVCTIISERIENFQRISQKNSPNSRK
jgi:predicted nucleotide-binding protein/CheY-like chemotaxis protein